MVSLPHRPMRTAYPRTNLMDKRVKQLRSTLSEYPCLRQCYEDVIAGAGCMLEQEQGRYREVPATATYRRLKEREFQFLKDGVEHIEQIIKTMEKSVGAEATEIMVRIYSEREGVENVGYSLGYSRRSLESRLKIWMTTVVNDMAYTSKYTSCEVDASRQAGSDWQMASCRKKSIIY